MNCANHADVSATAYCRTCGKPMCASCARNVHGVIYCENCLAARLEGVQPPTVYPPVAGQGMPQMQGSGPNPALAGILAGVFPFGVGAVYTSQYAKGLAHLLIWFGLIWGVSHSDSAAVFFGLSIAFFYVYQIIDAVKSAHAVQAGQPVPDPFGLGQAFGSGEKVDTTKIPTGAVILIGLGVLFLLHTAGIFEFGFDRIWPLLITGLGLWLFVKGWGLAARTPGRCYCERCRTRRLTGPAILISVGVLSFLDSFRDIGFLSFVGAILLVVGVVKLLQGNASAAGHIDPMMPAPPGIGAPPPIEATPQAPPPANEVKNV